MVERQCGVENVGASLESSWVGSCWKVVGFVWGKQEETHVENHLHGRQVLGGKE